MKTGCEDPEPYTVSVDPDNVPLEEDKKALCAVTSPELLTNKSCTEADVTWKEAEFMFTEAVTLPVAIWFVIDAPPALRANEAVSAYEELITELLPKGPNTFDAVTKEAV